MNTIDKDVKATLWAAVKPEVEQPLALFLGLVGPGLKPRKGQTKGEVVMQAVMEVVKAAYESGLERGYDMAREVFAPPSTDKKEG